MKHFNLNSIFSTAAQLLLFFFNAIFCVPCRACFHTFNFHPRFQWSGKRYLSSTEKHFYPSGYSLLQKKNNLCLHFFEPCINMFWRGQTQGGLSGRRQYLAWDDDEAGFSAFCEITKGFFPKTVCLTHTFSSKWCKERIFFNKMF